MNCNLCGFLQLGGANCLALLFVEWCLKKKRKPYGSFVGIIENLFKWDERAILMKKEKNSPSLMKRFPLLREDVYVQRERESR